jgi:hypothetical protein
LELRKGDNTRLHGARAELTSTLYATDTTDGVLSELLEELLLLPPELLLLLSLCEQCLLLSLTLCVEPDVDLTCLGIKPCRTTWTSDVEVLERSISRCGGGGIPGSLGWIK